MVLIDERRQRTDELADQSIRAIALRVERSRQQLASGAASLDALSPLKVLARGYAIATLPDGELLRSVEEAESSKVIHARLSDGTVHCTVKSVSRLS